jgi:hypothetical protein
MSSSTLIPPSSRSDQGPPSPASTPPSAPPAKVAPPEHRRRWWVIAVAAVAAIVLAVVGWLVWSSWVPSAPGTPTAATVTATSVELQWTASTEGPTVDAYVVQRDGAEVGTVDGSTTTYLDQGLVPDSSHSYAIVAGSGDKRSDPSTELVVRTLPGAPTSLEVAERTTTSVTIAWSSPTSGRTPDGFVVLRNGSEVATVEGAVLSYRDTGLTPVTSYTYTVVTVQGDLQSSPSAPLEVTTKSPAVSSAQLTGDYGVEGKITGAQAGTTLGGSAAEGQTFSGTWTFEPQGTGTPSTLSPVEVTGTFAGHPFTMTLKPSDGTWTGSTKAHITHCDTPGGSKDVTNTVNLSLKVKAADVVSGDWAATSWTGTMKLATPYTAVGTTGWYCPSATLTASLTGTALGATS